MAPPPKQSFTPAELDEAIDKQQPVLNSLLEAVVEKAPSLCRPSALLPLALAAWTDSEQWVRPLNDWAGEAKTDVDNADDADEREAAALRSLAAHLLKVGCAAGAPRGSDLCGRPANLRGRAPHLPRLP